MATASGRGQEEACHLDRPCRTLCDEVEWGTLVDCGGNTVVGAGTDASHTALTAPIELAPKPWRDGDGEAAGRTVSSLDGHAGR